MRFDSTADVKARNETQICLTTPPLLSRSYFIPTLDKWIKAQPSKGSPGVSGLLLVLGKKKKLKTRGPMEKGMLTSHLTAIQK